MTILSLGEKELNTAFDLIDEVEVGAVYLLLHEDALELAVGVDGPLKSYSTIVFLTGPSLGAMRMEERDPGSKAWRVAQVGLWSEVRLVFGSSNE